MSGDVVERLRETQALHIERARKEEIYAGYELRAFADEAGEAADLITSQAAEIKRLEKNFEAHLLRLSAALGGMSRYSNEQGDYRSLDDWAAFLLKRTETLRLDEHSQRRLLAEARAALEPFDGLFRDFVGPVKEEWFDRFAKATLDARTLTNGGENGR